jgi:DNA-binding transcriptional MerR regulator
MFFVSADALLAAAEGFCAAERIQPASGGASAQLTLRTFRYYRSLGLVDAPGPEGYGERHLLQLIAIRILQAMGQPLRRIQVLLQGRSLDELRRIRTDGLRDLKRHAPAPSPRWVSNAEQWSAAPIDDEWLIISRSGRSLSPELREQFRTLLRAQVPTL